MLVKYGTYTHDPNEVAIDAINCDALMQNGVVYGRRERWELSGMLMADSQSALTTKIQALIAAYSVQGQDLVVYVDDAGTTESAHKLKAADTFGGVKIISPPSFPTSGVNSAEYSTYRTYRIAVEAEFPYTDASLVQWSEVLNYTGNGGPRFGFKTPLIGPPVKQLLVQQTTCRVVQSGRAVGLLTYPFPASPIWPDAEHLDQRQVTLEMPERIGPVGSPAYMLFGISWAYTFEHSEVLPGTPTPWPL